MQMTVVQYEDIKQLNSFLRGELSAVHAYGQCIEQVPNAQVILQLRSLQGSHDRRAKALAHRIETLGGKPAESGGLWGCLAQAIEGGAGLLGPQAALSALGEGESLGLADYEKHVDKLSSLQRISSKFKFFLSKDAAKRS
jgi:demethoxyubiquinone hydroxylase (CLK1/Coq7/Cat5 family)